MPDTPSTRWTIERPADTDLIHDWPSIMRTSLDRIDALMAGVISDDPRPAAGVFGRYHKNLATGVLSFDNGTSWEEVARIPHAAHHAEGGADPVLGQVPIGGVIPYAGSALPPTGEWAWADGHLIDRTTYATFFGRVGHAYNGGVDPGGNSVRVPDKRGRVPMGADNFGVGAANRIPTELGAGRGQRGQNGGAERVQLTSGESGVPAHSHPITDPWHHHDLPDHTHQVGGGGKIPSYDANAANLIGLNNVTPYGFAVGAVNAGGWFGWTQGSGGSSNLGMYNAGTGISVNNNGAAGAGSSHQNLQPYEADNYIVRIA